MHPSKRKGDAAEREAAKLLELMFGFDIVRALGAGRKDDTGDLEGLPDCTVQVVSRTTDVVNVALVEKPLEVERQRVNRGTTFAVTLVRVRGGKWRAVMTLDQFAVLYREAMS